MAIVYAINHILEAVCLYYYIFSIHPHKHSLATDISATFGSYLFLFIIFLNKILNLNIIFQFVVFFLLFLYLTHDSYIRCIFHSTLTLLIITVSELIFDIPTVLFHKDTAFEYPTVYAMVLAMIIQRTVHFILVIVAVKIQKNTYDDYPPVISDALSTFFLFICTAAIIAIQNLGFVSVLSKRQIPWVYIILFSILFLSVGVVATIYVIKKKQYELNHTREELQRMESDEGYNKLITQIDTDQKIMIHDIKNHLQIIQDSLASQDFSKAKTHIDELVLSNALTGGSVITDNPTLSLLLARYKDYCQNEGIIFSSDIKDAHLSYLSPSDITSLLCNLFDNAIEACHLAENPVLTLRICTDKERKMDLISITNTCKDQPIFDKNGFLATIKADKMRHGFGMQSIKRVVERYNGVIEPKYIKEESLFQVSICLYSEV